MPRTPWFQPLLLGTALGALSTTASCNALLGNPAPDTAEGYGGEGGLGGRDAGQVGDLGGRSSAGGQEGSDESGGSQGSGGSGIGGSAPLPEASIALSVSGLEGAVTIEANGA